MDRIPPGSLVDLLSDWLSEQIHSQTASSLSMVLAPLLMGDLRLGFRCKLVVCVPRSRDKAQTSVPRARLWNNEECLVRWRIMDRWHDHLLFGLVVHVWGITTHQRSGCVLFVSSLASLTPFPEPAPPPSFMLLFLKSWRSFSTSMKRAWSMRHSLAET